MKYKADNWNIIEVKQDNCDIYFTMIKGGINNRFNNGKKTIVRDATNWLDVWMLQDIDKKYNLNLKFN